MEPACDFVDFVEVVTYRGHDMGLWRRRVHGAVFSGSDGQAFFFCF